MENVKEKELFPIAVTLKLRVRDPLFISKHSIATYSTVFFVSIDTTHDALSALINDTVAKEKLLSWSFIEWSRYSTLPLQIRARHGHSPQYTGDTRPPPTEQLLTTDKDVTKALGKLKDTRGSDHLVVSVMIYEGDGSTAEDTTLVDDEGDENNGVECQFCGREHGFGECVDRDSGIHIEPYGDPDDDHREAANAQSW